MVVEVLPVWKLQEQLKLVLREQHIVEVDLEVLVCKEVVLRNEREVRRESVSVLSLSSYPLIPG